MATLWVETSPASSFEQGWEGQGSEFASEATEKIRYFGKAKQMVSEADSSACGKANPCGHPACNFVEQTAWRIDSRLT